VTRGVVVLSSGTHIGVSDGHRGALFLRAIRERLQKPEEFV
jgi:hypothetical protein